MPVSAPAHGVTCHALLCCYTHRPVSVWLVTQDRHTGETATERERERALCMHRLVTQGAGSAWWCGLHRGRRTRCFTCRRMVLASGLRCFVPGPVLRCCAAGGGVPGWAGAVGGGQGSAGGLQYHLVCTCLHSPCALAPLLFCGRHSKLSCAPQVRPSCFCSSRCTFGRALLHTGAPSGHTLVAGLDGRALPCLVPFTHTRWCGCMLLLLPFWLVCVGGSCRAEPQSRSAQLSRGGEGFLRLVGCMCVAVECLVGV